MIKKLALTLICCSASAFAQSSSCGHLIGSCEYYTCVENDLISCGENGYTLGYGYHYCQNFRSYHPSQSIDAHEKELFPVDWNHWLDKTANCLHSAIDHYLINSDNATCTNLRLAAFESHATCYTSEDSFCFLPPQQIAHIGAIISAHGFLQPETLQQVSQTATICVKQINERLSHETSIRNTIELSLYRDAWNILAQHPQTEFSLDVQVPHM